MAVLKKHQRTTYTPIDNQALRDEALSWKATGLLAYLLSLPDDWKINVTDLANRKTDGRTATSSAMGELEDGGYVARTKVRDDSGRFHTTVHCAESPDLLREIVDQPMLDLPTSEKPTVGEPATTKEPSGTTQNEITTSSSNGFDAFNLDRARAWVAERRRQKLPVKNDEGLARVKAKESLFVARSKEIYAHRDCSVCGGTGTTTLYPQAGGSVDVPCDAEVTA